ncbi:MAG: tRNA preQ1(34) S-adenosylmethionine ribosyltransferase-isomerase QueA [Candidatus Omnitrophica bacterium]|nr:tRNA preQ1(34) S-adenosylmethionine ribosyltransferase-isomerase QueA [Candidatus Omnitrophota bacterium]
MISPRSRSLSSYFYHLPQELIAQKPASRRQEARLLVIDRARGKFIHDTFDHINDYLPARSCVVINNSKVIPARLLGQRKTGGAVELFLLNEKDDGYSFEVLVKPLKKIREGEEIYFDGAITAVLEDKEKRIVRFNKKNIIRHLKKIGHIPLPPYIKRQDTKEDREDYQTVYAKHPGSVASPTAGLHFSRDLMKGLKTKGHRFFELTLHINYGTFKPVECPDIREHPMHTEHYSIKPAVYNGILKAKKEFRPLVAVGTTTTRVLESVAISRQLNGSTNLFIYSGYKFQMLDALITNFHLPHSTLLMLVCAFGGYDLIMKAYQEAIQKHYRFYSYGDAMLIL